MVNANIVQRTFKIECGNCLGTCFTIDVDNRQYIVTAKHLVEKITGRHTIKLMHEKKWKNLEVELIGHCKGQVDISVLAAEFQISWGYSLPATTAGMILGQDVYFLGFPYGLMSDVGELNRNFPFPLVKKGVLSTIEPSEGCILLDGHNNPGFSGGPVVFCQNNRGNDFSVAGVVSGYRYAREPVYKNEEPEENEPPIGYYRANTGIVLAYDIKYALDLISQNPIGAELKTGNVKG
ncbi:MAG: serine protease [Candidatus Poribacteria bacterium]|nr:serine protease [Candidatus Poribacteria bacterium]